MTWMYFVSLKLHILIKALQLRTAEDSIGCDVLHFNNVQYISIVSYQAIAFIIPKQMGGRRGNCRYFYHSAGFVGQWYAVEVNLVSYHILWGQGLGDERMDIEQWQRAIK